MFWHSGFCLAARRRRLYKITSPGPLKDYYAQPFVDLNASIEGAKFISLDFETTGLDPNNDHIVSVGRVEIQQLSIMLSSAWHQIVFTSDTLSEKSVVIHGVTDDVVSTGITVSQLMPHLFARLERQFLNRLCLNLYGQVFLIPCVDTEQLAKRLFRRRNRILQDQQYRLAALREIYRLPAHRAHNALNDALATAELFLALLADICPTNDCKIKDLLT